VHKMKAILLSVALLALTACSVRPDGSNGARRDFVLSGVGYEQAYQRALDFARTCHTGGGIFKHLTVTNEQFASSREAYVHLAYGGSSMPEQINIKGGPHNDVQVSVVVIGRGMWDTRELDAAQRSIESGTPSCR